MLGIDGMIEKAMLASSWVEDYGGKVFEYAKTGVLYELERDFRRQPAADAGVTKPANDLLDCVKTCIKDLKPARGVEPMAQLHEFSRGAEMGIIDGLADVTSRVGLMTDRAVPRETVKFFLKHGQSLAWSFARDRIVPAIVPAAAAAVGLGLTSIASPVGPIIGGLGILQSIGQEYVRSGAKVASAISTRAQLFSTLATAAYEAFCNSVQILKARAVSAPPEDDLKDALIRIRTRRLPTVEYKKRLTVYKDAFNKKPEQQPQQLQQPQQP